MRMARSRTQCGPLGSSQTCALYTSDVCLITHHDRGGGRPMEILFDRPKNTSHRPCLVMRAWSTWCDHKLCCQARVYVVQVTWSVRPLVDIYCLGSGQVQHLPGSDQTQDYHTVYISTFQEPQSNSLFVQVIGGLSVSVTFS